MLLPNGFTWEPFSTWNATTSIPGFSSGKLLKCSSIEMLLPFLRASTLKPVPESEIKSLMVGLQASEGKLGAFFGDRRVFLMTMNVWPPSLPMPKAKLDSQPLQRVLMEAKGYKAYGR